MRFMVTLIRDETDREAPEEMKERGARMMQFMGERGSHLTEQANAAKLVNLFAIMACLLLGLR